MKKFLMYVCVLIGLLFVGFTSYFFFRNTETIICTISTNDAKYLNVGESFQLPIVWEHKSKQTRLDVQTPKVGELDIVTYDNQTKKFTAKNGGVAIITINSSNKEFGPFKFNVYVGDGSVDTPFYIDSAEDMARIGADTEPEDGFKLDKSYQLIKNIDLSEVGDWTPIGANSSEGFAGSFNGNGYSIFNVQIEGTHSNAGLFSVVSPNAFVENVRVSDETISGSYQTAGGIAGINYGFIGKCEVLKLSINNTLDTGKNGGIAGLNSYNTTDNKRAYIEMCSAEGSYQTNGYTGGIVGNNVASILVDNYAIIKSYIKVGSSGAFGGLVGYDISQEFSKTTLEINNITQQFNNVTKNVYTSSYYKNNFVIFKSAYDKSANKSGTFIGLFDDLLTKKSLKNYYIINNYYYIEDNVDYKDISYGYYDTSITSMNGDMISFRTLAQFKNKTYFDSTMFNGDRWILEDNQPYPYINKSASYQTLNIMDTGSSINNINFVRQLLELIRGNRGDSSTYIIENLGNNNVLDLNGEEWTTIAPDIDEPLKASIIVKNCELIIKNFKLTGNNTSFFGYISGKATFQGISFDEVKINHSTNLASSAVIATDLLNTATLKDCKVKGVDVTDSMANYIGLISAKNTSGNIIGCDVFAQNSSININVDGNNVVAGAIVGLNNGKVDNCSVKGVIFNVNSADKNSTVTIGCAVGQSTTELNNIYVYNALIKNDTYNGNGSIGGVVGLANGNVLNSFSLAGIDVSTSNDKVRVGGIASQLAKDCKIENSFFGNIAEDLDALGNEIDADEVVGMSSLSGYYVGGIVCDNYGTITKSYVEASVTGARGAGLAVYQYGQIDNCSVNKGTILCGVSNKSRMSGFVSVLREGSKVEYCFSTANFIGEYDETHYGRCAETESKFRFTLENWLNFRTDDELAHHGDLKNCIVVNYGNALIQSAGVATVFGGDDFIKVTDAQCKGSDGWKAFKSTAGFNGSSDVNDNTIWYLPNATEDSYPSIKSVVKNPKI